MPNSGIPKSAPSHVEVVLTSLECIRQQEYDANGDEIYVTADIAFLDGQKLGKQRFPHEFGFWQMLAGKTVKPEQMVYIGDLGAGLKLEITTMEMDMVKLSQGSVGIVGTWVDDFIGRFTVTIRHDGRIETTDGKHAARQGQSQIWRLTGHKAEYLLGLDVRIQ